MDAVRNYMPLSRKKLKEIVPKKYILGEMVFIVMGLGHNES